MHGAVMLAVASLTLGNSYDFSIVTEVIQDFDITVIG